MKFSDEDMEHLEKLANIDIDPDSRERLVLDMSRIIGFVEKLQDTLTTGGQERVEQGGMGTRLREDIPSACLERDVVLEQAPDSHRGHFRIPPVIDGEMT